ncbi:MAG: hypothetical protein ACSLEM_01070 [Candidatus Malihini olakiniferum]
MRYEVGNRVIFEDVVWQCQQAHISQFS